MVTGCVYEHSILVPGSTLHADIFMDCAECFKLAMAYSHNCNKEELITALSSINIV